ncbi:MAG: type II toxin-antitoxin system RelE/ParE family toxin [Burkholderiaceae bacterium]|jgi:mRNA-degrading endonuclease RelE of RelBE toxin-antitoxin system|nr:type II toxin-antitoxin system RelE/ParE family toxin [Burkholderiaceae bacterium]
MLTVVETADFARDSAKIWNEEERDRFVDWIARNPTAGDVIPQTGGARKVRWGRNGTGKSGGVRVIYFNADSEGTVILFAIYAKSERENMRPKAIRRK